MRNKNRMKIQKKMRNKNRMKIQKNTVYLDSISSWYPHDDGSAWRPCLVPISLRIVTNEAYRMRRFAYSRHRLTKTFTFHFSNSHLFAKLLVEQLSYLRWCHLLLITLRACLTNYHSLKNLWLRGDDVGHDGA